MTTHLAWSGDTDLACGLSFDAARKQASWAFVALDEAKSTDCPGCRKGALALRDETPLGSTQGNLFSAAAEPVYPVDARQRGAALQRARYAQSLMPSHAAARLGLSTDEYTACERGEKAFDLGAAELWMRSPL